MSGLDTQLPRLGSGAPCWFWHSFDKSVQAAVQCELDPFFLVLLCLTERVRFNVGRFCIPFFVIFWTEC